MQIKSNQRLVLAIVQAAVIEVGVVSKFRNYQLFLDFLGLFAAMAFLFETFKLFEILAST